MNYKFLANTLLFRGVTPEEIELMMGCLDGYVKTYNKGETIYHSGEYIQKAGLVLSGSVHIENDDLWGNKTILAHVGAGQVFAETYVCIPGEPLMINVVATEPVEILFLNLGRGTKTCARNCAFHGRLIQNLLAISAQKNLNLSRRIFYTTSKSIRGRLLSYLSDQATRYGSLEFDIPFNRQQLADYLGVDRSAMSNELSKMQKESLLTVNKNHFCLNQASLESL
jgi:CRP-like cAMP-binding protein